MAHYEIEELDLSGEVRVEKFDSLAELGKLLGTTEGTRRIFCVEDDGRRRRLTPLEGAALAAAMEQHTRLPAKFVRDDAIAEKFEQQFEPPDTEHGGDP
jgi:hypothetical protein